MLLLARGLFAHAAGTLAEDPVLIARLIDRLAEELVDTRAHVARELLGAPELERRRRGYAAEALLALVEGGDRRLRTQNDLAASLGSLGQLLELRLDP